MPTVKQVNFNTKKLPTPTSLVCHSATLFLFFNRPNAIQLFELRTTVWRKNLKSFNT